jgi:hypothetical protein
MSIFSNIPLNTTGNFICCQAQCGCFIFVPVNVKTTDEMVQLRDVLQTELDNQVISLDDKPEIDT